MGILGGIKKAFRSQSFIIRLVCIISTVFSIFAGLNTVMTFTEVNSWIDLKDGRSGISDEINRLSLKTYEASMQLRSYSSTSSEDALNTYLSVMKTVSTDRLREEINALDCSAELSDALNGYIASVNGVLNKCADAYDLLNSGNTAAAQTVLFADSFTDSLLEVLNAGDALLGSVDLYLTPELDTYSLLHGLFSALTTICLVLVSGIQVFLVIYTAKAMLKPVRLIKDELINFSNGNYSSEFTIREDDSDIGQLSAAINASKKLLHKMTEELSWLLDQIAQGNVSFYINLEYVGEFKAIKAAMNTILEENNNEFAKIRGSADSISTAADDMSQSSIKVAEGGQEQSESIATLSESISDIYQKINANAANAQAASEYSKKADISLEKGRREMAAMVDSMKDIEATSHEINKIIRTIEDIAFETNILSLNAAVEAASAGDAGKGFGVVADQVRLLSGTVAEAVKNTTELIEKAIAAINQGSQHAIETAKTMKAIVEDSRRSNEVIVEIATAASEEKAAVKEISTQVQRIESVINSNNTAAEQSAAAAEELASQASMLRQIMERYQLRD